MMTKLQACETVLEFATGAITDAIYTEEGLDGVAGERVLTIIAEYRKFGTFDTHRLTRNQMLRILHLSTKRKAV